MKIAYYGGQTAGLVCLLGLLADDKHKVVCVYPQDQTMLEVADPYSIPVRTIVGLRVGEDLDWLKANTDLLLCCHARSILPEQIVDNFPCLNLHPSLYRYKGADPLGKMIEENNTLASVASHWMMAEVDAGPMVVEKYKVIPNLATLSHADIYRLLYPLYLQVMFESLKIVEVVSGR